MTCYNFFRLYPPRKSFFFLAKFRLFYSGTDLLPLLLTGLIWESNAKKAFVIVWTKFSKLQFHFQEEIIQLIASIFNLWFSFWLKLIPLINLQCHIILKTDETFVRYITFRQIISIFANNILLAGKFPTNFH